MPEEINRRLIDQLSNILFVPTNSDIENLRKERLLINKLISKLNTISDVIKNNLPLIKKNEILKNNNLKNKDYF